MKLNNKGFSKIEILFIIVIVSIVLVSGLAIVFVAKKNADVKTFKQDSDAVIKAAKNSYATMIKKENTEYIVTSEDGSSKGMCITLKGLQDNEFLSKNYDDKWDGYVVIEELNDEYQYTIWITNKKYVIDGYESAKINELTIKNQGITAYNDNEFSSKVKTSFTGTTSSKGGTAVNTIKRYEAKCINEKVE